VSRIGRYEIESELGRGAMGTVYLAYDPGVRRRVALKTFLVPSGLSAEQRRDRQERFLREAQAAGALSHPGIVTIFEVDEDPLCDLPFIAMEYVPGRTLQQVIRDGGPLPAERVREIAATLSGALHTAHQSGVVHRDVKPANVLVRDGDGAVKITDFGVARVPTSELTTSGTPVGSPAYMSPEQLRGGEIDGRSDLFSLAAILYQALCGERPFVGDDVPSVTYAIVHEDPGPITRRVADLPVALDRFFARALAKDPGQRYPNAPAFGTAIQEALDEATPEVAAAAPAAATQPLIALAPPEPERKKGPKPRREPRTPLAVLPHRSRWAFGAVLAVLAITVVWLLTGGGPEVVGDTPEVAAENGDAGATEADEPGLIESARSALGLAEDAYLEIEGKSSVKSGALVVLVDGVEVFTRELSTEDRNVKRFFKKVSGKAHEIFDARIPVSAGEREIVVVVQTQRRESPYEESVTVELEPGESRTLEVIAGRTFGDPLSVQMP
jgi:serine/threonine-protein kinase